MIVTTYIEKCLQTEYLHTEFFKGIHVNQLDFNGEYGRDNKSSEKVFWYKRRTIKDCIPCSNHKLWKSILACPPQIQEEVLTIQGQNPEEIRWFVCGLRWKSNLEIDNSAILLVDGSEYYIGVTAQVCWKYQIWARPCRVSRKLGFTSSRKKFGENLTKIFLIN